MNHYLVESPSYTTHYDGYDPPDTGPDICFVQAENEEDAKVMSLKCDGMKGWVRNARDYHVNPLAGLKVENMRCDHGFCHCDECTKEVDICPQCDAEADERERLSKETV
jgi:hypothetical protein